MTFRQLAAIPLVMTIACTARDTDDAGNAPAVSGPRPAPEVVAQAVDSLATRVLAEGLTPALGVAVVMDGQPILTKSYGYADATHRVPADSNTLWYLASTSKSYTGFGIALLAHQGALNFNTPIASLLPNAQWPRGYDASKQTLADFLSHTHRLRDRAVVMNSSFTASIPESEWPKLLRFAETTSKRNLEYSNLGYNVAAMVIDTKRPEGWRAYLDSAVYKPAGMSNTYTRMSGIDASRIATTHELRADGTYATSPFYKIDATMSSAGGHLATLHDLARWITVQMDSGKVDGKRVFPPEAVALSHRMIAEQTVDDRKRFAYFDRKGWGAGWDIGFYEGEPMVSRFGGYSSTRSHLSFLPRRRIGVVAQTNGELGAGATDIIAAFAYDLERGDPNARATAQRRLQKLTAARPEALAAVAQNDSVRAARRQRPLRRPATDFAGSYHHEWYGTITFEAHGNEVHYQWGAIAGVADVLDARSCHWFRCSYSNALRIDVGDSGNSVQFYFPDVGPATGLELKGEKFTRLPGHSP
ncbi:MAG TPA: serine hydrolase [Longimicrobiales bacterium]|nr:serine hydrolase [Longimicrobiales bacterium]